MRQNYFNGVGMLLELLQKRRSIRKFKAKSIEQGKIDYLLESVLRSPSSRSLNPWEFVVVDEQEQLQELSRAKPHGAGFLKNAPLAIAVCADPEKCDVWIEDCSIAALLLHLAAADIGLGSCWVQIRLRQHESGVPASKRAAEILGLEERMEVEAIMALGYADEEKPGHARDQLLWERVHYNRYGLNM
jgi:nitroreductase